MNTFIKAEDLGIQVENNLLVSKNFTRNIDIENVSVNSFKPIGIGKPLVIRLHTVHVGDLKNGILNKKQAVLVTSVIKDDITSGVPPRGVHQIFNKIQDRQTLYPKASGEGTELIYYSKAFDINRLKVDIEVKADRFNQDVVDDISNTLGTAAQLPVFAPYAPFVLIGGELLKTSGDIINKAIEKIPILSFPFNISFNISGIKDSKSGYYIGGELTELEDFRKDYKIVEDKDSQGNIYLAKNGVKYTGDIPYVIISVDGRSNHRYDDFKATVASASILKKFYGISENTYVDDIQKMTALYNDYSYIEKVRDTEKLIKKTKDEQKVKELTELLEAYKSNIGNEDLQKIISENK